LQTDPNKAKRVRNTWTKLLEPPADEQATSLPIQVVHSIQPGLPGLVASLLGRPQEKYQEAILIGFLNGGSLPELAVELPSKPPPLTHGPHRQPPHAPHRD